MFYGIYRFTGGHQVVFRQYVFTIGIDDDGLGTGRTDIDSEVAVTSAGNFLIRVHHRRREFYQPGHFKIMLFCIGFMDHPDVSLFSPRQQCRPQRFQIQIILRDNNLHFMPVFRCQYTLDRLQNGSIRSNTAREIDRLLVCPLALGNDHAGNTFAQCVTHRFDRNAFLLEMDQVALCKHTASGCHSRRIAVVF